MDAAHHSSCAQLLTAVFFSLVEPLRVCATYASVADSGGSRTRRPTCSASAVKPGYVQLSALGGQTHGHRP